MKLIFDLEFLDYEEVKELTGWSSSFLANLVRDETLRTTYLGRKKHILKNDLTDFLRFGCIYGSIDSDIAAYKESLIFNNAA